MSAEAACPAFPSISCCRHLSVRDDMPFDTIISPATCTEHPWLSVPMYVGASHICLRPSWNQPHDCSKHSLIYIRLLYASICSSWLAAGRCPFETVLSASCFPHAPQDRLSNMRLLDVMLGKPRQQGQGLHQIVHLEANVVQCAKQGRSCAPHCAL